MFVCRMRVEIASPEQCPVVYCVPQCAHSYGQFLVTGEVRSVAKFGLQQQQQQQQRQSAHFYRSNNMTVTSKTNREFSC